MGLFTVNLSPDQIQEVLAYFDCFVSDERDPDMQGFIVRVSAFIVNICLAILIKWSKDDLISPVGIVFLQVYTILLATFITMRNKDMSIPDSHFALVLTISPLSVYFVYATARFLFRRQTLLYRRLSRTYQIVVAVSTLIMLSLWIVMQFLMYFAGDHFFGDDDGKLQCSHPSFRSWWFYRLVEFCIYVNWSIYLIPVFLALFIVYALRHVVDIWREAKHHRSVVAKRRWCARWIQSPWIFCHVYHQVYLDRCHTLASVVHFLRYHHNLLDMGRSHRPTLTSMASFYGLISTSLRESAGEEPTARPDDPSVNDIFAYGQLLAGAATIEPIYRVLKLAYTRRRDFWVQIKHLPQWIWNGVLYFFAGRENPWEGVLRGRKATEDTQDIQPYTLVDDELESEWGLRESGLVDKFLLVRLEMLIHRRVSNLQSAMSWGTRKPQVPV
ncbi:hypothetical protein CPB85DRAFT_878007 [Mucidula mucida]|nr:hypothetical protein CPB85DRAFT_878007 [Mucidula mucida]